MIINPYAFGSAPNAWEQEVIALAPEVWLRFSEISGSVFADSSGNGHNASKQGTPSLNQAPVFVNMGPSALFNSGAADQFASIPDDAALDFVTNDFLVMAAFKRAGTMGGTFGKIIFKTIDSGMGTANYMMQYQKSTDKVIARVTHAGGNVDATSTTTFADATPYLVAIRRVADEISFWANGTKEAFSLLPSPSTALMTSANPVDAFGSTAGGADPFTGYGDEVVIVNGTVSDATMAALWAARQ